MEQKHAWYSAKMDARCGHVVWESAEGKEVFCTSVSDDSDHGMGWDDVVPMGMVQKFVRSSEKRMASSKRLFPL